MTHNCNIKSTILIILLLLTAGCNQNPLGERIGNSNQNLSPSPAELIALQHDLKEVTRWHTLQQKTVDDYFVILLRQGVTNPADNLEWVKRKNRADQYAQARGVLERRIEQLQLLVNTSYDDRVD